MLKWTLHITLWDLAFLLAIAAGLIFGVLLLLVPRVHRAANRYLGLAVLVMALWLCWVLNIDVWLQRYFPRWSWLPWQWSLALGPLIFLYVRKLLFPARKLGLYVLLHFIPVLFEQYALFAAIAESRRSGVPSFDTAAFQFFSPIVSGLALISVVVYSVLALRELRIYRRLISGVLSDADSYQYRWLQRLLLIMALLWLLWLPFTAVDYFCYGYHLPLAAYHPLHLALALIVIWIGIEAFLRPEIVLVELPVQKPKPPGAVPSPETQAQVARVRQEMEKNLFYLDPELSLRSLAEILDLHPQELSYIINAGSGQNFSDFINTYRVAEVKRKMADPAFAHITLLGIAFASGFNSKTTFNRTFKQLTGSSPAEYKKGTV